MVFIHGGGFTSGSGSVFLYRGGNLVRNGDAVVVTINYRLGALGFLGHRDLADPDGLVGNWGIQDQLAALRWVRDNIAAFGGDPSNVTIFGESAGGFSVATLLGTPAAAGLFRRAIVQSGGAHVHTVEEAERSAERLAAVLGHRVVHQRVTASDSRPPSSWRPPKRSGKRRPDPGMIPLPVPSRRRRCRFLPDHPLAAVANGAAAGIDLLIGTNRDELTLFGLGNPALMALDEDGVQRWVANAVPDMPRREVIDAYRAAGGPRAESVEPTAIWVAVGTDIVFRWPSLQLAAAHAARGSRAFVYLFDWESPAFGGILGSCHALELPFVFGAVHLPVVQVFSGGGPAVETLSAQMQGAWLAFAATGSPSHDGIGAWRPWDPGQPRHHDLRGRHGPGRARRGTRSSPSWSGIARSSRACPAERGSPEPPARGHESACTSARPRCVRSCGAGGDGCRCGRLLRVQSGGPVSWNDENVRRSSSSATADLQRARQVRPRQKWTPCPKVRCGLGSRAARTLRAGESARIGFGRTLPHDDLVARPDGLATQMALGGRRPALGRRRRRPAQDLLHGAIHGRGPIAGGRAARASRGTPARHPRSRCASSRLPQRRGARRMRTARRRSGGTASRPVARRGSRSRACRHRLRVLLDKGPYCGIMNRHGRLPLRAHRQEVGLVRDVEDVLAASKRRWRSPRAPRAGGRWPASESSTASVDQSRTPGEAREPVSSPAGAASARSPRARMQRGGDRPSC